MVQQEETSFFDSVGNFFESAANKVENVVSTVYHDVTGGISTVYHDVADTATSVVDTGEHIYKGITDAGETAVTDISSGTKNVAETVATGVVTDIPIIAGNVKDVANNTVNKAQQAIGDDAVGKTAKGLSNVTSNLQLPLILAGGAALLFTLKN